MATATKDKAESKTLAAGDALVEVTALDGGKFHLNPNAIRQVHARIEGGSSLLMVDGTTLVVVEEMSPSVEPLSAEAQAKVDEEKAEKAAAEAAVESAKSTAVPGSDKPPPEDKGEDKTSGPTVKPGPAAPKPAAPSPKA
jgi:uncharacterized protein YlzI (FlbEa/FlbD family)